MDNSLPLAGIQVVSIEHAIAAPLCTRQLAELGARVIKIERRLTGDFARAYDTRTKGLSSHFVWTNRGKESLTLDLKTQQAQTILGRLLENTDVLVQNLAPSAAARMGLTFEDLHETHPGLIVCNISGYGGSGPYADKKAYDLLVQAEAGFLSVTGTADQMAKSGISIADIAAGMQAHSAILAALLKRNRTDTGSRIDISMLEAMVEWMGFPLYYAYEGAAPPSRTGTDHASIYPYGAFATGDDKVIMVGLQNEREWQVFCNEIIGQPELRTDERFASNTLRSNNRELLRQIVQAQFIRLPADQLVAKLDQAGIACANVNDMTAVWNHPQLHALKRIVEIETPNGPVKSFRSPGNNNSFQHKTGSVPDIGEHSMSILAELGFEENDIAQLKAKQVI
ncbi:MAG: CoA transferase [Gammaproteobacteria bacterium]|nr:CoA transferase [Gammaproteobacteria bacterium]